MIRPPRPCLKPVLPARSVAFSPPAQTTHRVGMTVPSSRIAECGVISLTDASDLQVHAGSAEHLRRRTRAPSPRTGRAVRCRDRRSCTRVAWTARSRYCSGRTSLMKSASAPAISTPVAPPPTMTKFRAPLSIRAGLRSAASNTSRIRERSRSASRSEYSGNACSSAPGVRKKFGCDPVAMHQVVAGVRLAVAPS